MTARYVSISLILAGLMAGCAGPSTPTPTPFGEIVTTEDRSFVASDTPAPYSTPTPGPSPTATLPGVPQVSCSGQFAYVMTAGKSNELHLVDACSALSLILPGDATPPLDYWVGCEDGSPAWFGNRLLYSVDYGGAGHGEIRVLDDASGAVMVLTPFYTMLDAATGHVVKANCAYPDECHPGAIRDGQVTFVNSGNPRWSPDGAEILFESMYFDTANHNQPSFRHFVMKSDGSDIRTLSDADAASLAQSWGGPATPGPALDYQSSDPGVKVQCSAWRP